MRRLALIILALSFLLSTGCSSIIQKIDAQKLIENRRSVELAEKKHAAYRGLIADEERRQKAKDADDVFFGSWYELLDRIDKDAAASSK